MIKKIGTLVAGLIVLLLILMAVIPLVYDVNTKVRPQIVKAIEDNLYAKAEIGKLNLSLWGGISIGIESLKIQETVMNSTVFEMKNAKLEIPFGAILGGELKVTLVADSPDIHIMRDKAGQMNVMKLMKPSSQTAAAPDDKKASGGLPGGAAGAAEKVKISTRITNAKVVFKDVSTNSSSTIDKLGLNLENIGVGSPMKLSISADLSVSQGADISLKGPMSFDGTAKVSLKPEGLDKVDVQAMLNLNELAIRYGTLFNKSPKVPLKIETRLTATSSSLAVEQLDLIANDFKISTSVQVNNFDAPQFDVKINSNKLRLENWRDIIAPLKEFDMAGGAGLKFSAKGTKEKIEYSGSLTLSEASLRSPGIVPKVEDINATLGIETDSVKLENFALKIGASDMSGSGVVKNFSAPNVQISLKSKNLNIDEMIGLKFDEKPAAPVKAEKEISQEEKDRQMEAMAKGPIQAIKGNPIMRKLVFKSNTKIGKMIVHKATMTDFDADVDFESLVLALKQAKLKAFSGSADAKMSVDFNGADPAYKIAANIKDLDVDQAVISQFSDLKGFITGRAQTTMDISGAGVTVAKAKQLLKGGGKFDIKNGTWSGLTPLKMIGEKLKSVPQAGSKMSGLEVGNRFKDFSGQYDIKNGRINLVNVIMDLEEARTGITAAGWIDFDKKMNIAGNLLIPLADAPKKLQGPDGRARIPFEIGGAMLSPQPNMDATLKPVASAYLEHEGKKAASAAIQQGVDQLKKNDKLKDVIKDDKVKDLMKGIGL